MNTSGLGTRQTHCLLGLGSCEQHLGLNRADVSAELTFVSVLLAVQEWMLPAAEFAGLWDSLVYDSDVKVAPTLMTLSS